MSSVDCIGVVIPACNEQASIGACLNALAVAINRAPCPVRVVLVADSCRDDTVMVARAASERLGLDTRIVAIEARSVGTARALGVQTLLDDAGGVVPWLCTTDADSTVPPDWLVRQVAHVARGADVIVGTVEVSDWSGHHPRLREFFAVEYATGRVGGSHRHIHGANLGFSAAAYAATGGFAGVRVHEDVLLVQAACALGLQVAWVDDLAVTTSARLSARAPEGFAHYLARARLTMVPPAPAPAVE